MGTYPRPLHIDPPLLNSSNPWCSTLQQLQDLYMCSKIGAVTTRTSMLNGFSNDERIHQFTFYNPGTHMSMTANPLRSHNPAENGSLNTFGYSPLPLKEYLRFIRTISDALTEPFMNIENAKPFIVSVTGTIEEVIECYKQLQKLQHHVRMTLAMEVNLSCPNIPDKPPPAYSSEALLSYLVALKQEIAGEVEPVTTGKYTDVHNSYVPIGIKTPPYTYHDQYQVLISALLESAKVEPVHVPCPISFLTATNTLGSCLLLRSTGDSTNPSDNYKEAFPHVLNSASGTGIGGLAGAALHPLALGNVYTIKNMLLRHESIHHIQIIGVGGVEDAGGYNRMRAAGATAVAVGTALGRKGIEVFEEIAMGVSNDHCTTDEICQTTGHK